MSIIERSKKEAGVSPVVGVMLMLVVTIIIAAVVAVFASGLGTVTETPTIGIYKLDSYSLGTVDQSSADNVTLSNSYKNGWYDYGLDSYGYAKSNYGIYSMKFRNNGGGTVYTDNLKLVVTYNAKSYTLPFKQFADKSEWAVGDSVTLVVSTNDLKKATKDGYYWGGWAYGLGQQSMAYSSPSSFDWEIMDENNYVIAKGTESTKWSQNVISVTVDSSYISGTQGILKVFAPAYDDGTEVTITVPSDAGFTLTPLTGTITDGAATISITPTLTGSDQKTATITVNVGSVSETASITVNTASP